MQVVEIFHLHLDIYGKCHPLILFILVFPREKNVFWDIIFLLCGVSDNQAYGRSMRDQVPECPVCFEQYSAETGVHQCGKGHFICGNCRSMVEVIFWDLKKIFKIR